MEGFTRMALTIRMITVALDMSKDFNTINMHTLIRKLLQTIIKGTIIELIANHITGRKAYTTYRNHNQNYINLKLAYLKVASFHPHYLTYTLRLTTTQSKGSGHVFEDDITIASTHKHECYQDIYTTIPS